MINVTFFGKNNFGCLGLGHKNMTLEPTVVEELSQEGIINFVNGYRHVIAFNEIGEIFCWGTNDWGELGNNTINNNYKPSLNKYLTDDDIIDICCGSDHSLGLNSLGEVCAWGSNSFGQVANGSNNDQFIPKKVSGLGDERVISIACGGYHSMVLTENGRVFCWGSNKCGQLGIGNNSMIFNNLETKKEFSNIPILVRVINDGIQAFVSKVCCGLEHSLLLTREGDIFVCGSNSKGQLGLGIEKNKHQYLPIKLQIESKFIDIATHFDCSISVALSDKGTYYVWGKFGREMSNIPIESDLKSFNEIFIKYEKITYKPIFMSSHFYENSFISDCDISVGKYTAEFDEFNLLNIANFGIVYEARNKKQDEIYAVKKIPLTEKYINMIFEELKIMAKLRSNHVVKVESAWIEKNYIDNFYSHSFSLRHVVFDPFKPLLLHIQMELFSKTLKDLIEQLDIELNQNKSQKMTPIRYYIASELFKEIVESVEYLHNKTPPVILRDLKTTNILVTNGMSGRFLKLIDFGLAKILQFDERLGSYKAPTVLTQKYDTKADIFSLGIIIRELFNLSSNMYFRTGEDCTLRLKYSNLFKLSNDMISIHKELRPTCNQILSNNSWALNIEDLKELINLEEIEKYSEEINNMDQSFHKFFMHRKLKYDQIN